MSTDASCSVGVLPAQYDHLINTADFRAYFSPPITGERVFHRPVVHLEGRIRMLGLSVADLQGIRHTVEVTAGSVYEAVAAALATPRGDKWIGQIGTGLTTVSVKVQQPNNLRSSIR